MVSVTNYGLNELASRLKNSGVILAIDYVTPVAKTTDLPFGRQPAT